MKNNRVQGLTIVIITAWLAGCASTRTRSIYSEPGFKSAGMQKVLVIGMFQNQDVRKLFEEEFVRQWKERGVKAVSSLEVLPSSSSLDRSTLAPIVKAQGYDAVLVTRILAKQTVPLGEQPAPYVVPNIPKPEQNEDSLWQIMFAPPVYTSEYELVRARTDLYDVASEKRVWSALSKTRVMQKVPKLIPPFVKVILKHLYETP